MDCRIEMRSVYAENILDRYSIKKTAENAAFNPSTDSIVNSSGTVHSVYRKAVNLLLGDRLLCLQPSGSPVSPVSLIINIPEADFNRMEIEKGDWVLITGNSVIIEPKGRMGEEYRFWRRKEDRGEVDLRLFKPLLPSKIRTLADELEEALGKDSSGGFRTVLFPAEHPAGQETGYPAEKMTGDPAEKLEGNPAEQEAGDQAGLAAGDLVAEAAGRWTGRADMLAGEQKWEEAADSLCRLIGLGTGLTPGGDDFLCGVLAGMIFCGLNGHPFAEILKNRIDLGLKRTNDISRMFLECALDDQYGLAVHGFYRETAGTILSEIRQIGHTSGIDTLCGILYTFRLQDKIKMI